jgi:hypothetical protein
MCILVATKPLSEPPKQVNSPVFLKNLSYQHTLAEQSGCVGYGRELWKRMSGYWLAMGEDEWLLVGCGRESVVYGRECVG